jgi:Type II secretion system (T2SS), protein E, N-terminal domain
MPLLSRGRVRLEERARDQALTAGLPRDRARNFDRNADPGSAQILDLLRAPRLAARLPRDRDFYGNPSRNPAFDPFLDPALGPAGAARSPRLPGQGAPRSGFFETCANPRCGSGWLKLWRSRRAPVFEGGWCCSPECMRAQVESALSRELDTRSAAPQARPHRIPLGLVLLEQGWITREQLRAALDAQKAAGEGRLGAWLVRGQAVSEERVTRALALQWSCPVLGLEFHRPEAMTALLPRLFVEALGALPLRVAAGRILYLGFEDRPDPVLAFALERVTGLRVESGVVPASHFRPAQERLLAARYPRSGLVETAGNAPLAHSLLNAIEQTRPADARLVRVHGCLWLRLWLRPQLGTTPEPEAVEDRLFSLAGR